MPGFFGNFKPPPFNRFHAAAHNQQLLAARMNKINLRKEYFRLSLNEIRQMVSKLELGRDFNGTVTWTEKAKAQQYYESLDIDKDSQAKEKWLEAARQRVERREKLLARMSVAQVEAMETNGHENLAPGLLS
jgi:hypothetical protein